MKLLITGGAGFIGSAVVREALLNHEYEVVCLDCLTYAGNLESLSSCNTNPKFFFEKVNICDLDSINKVLINHKPDVILHLAAESHVDRSIDDPNAFINTNINGTFTLLQASRKYFDDLDNSKKSNFLFHHVSTDEVYGDLANNENPFTEYSPYLPSSPYSASKAASDHLVRSWGRTFGLPYVITNCSNNYGPFQFPEKLIPHMILSAVNGKPMSIYGDGKQVRDWLYVKDHARALLKVMKEGKIGNTYNIGGHNERTNIEVVNNICEILEKLDFKKPHGVSRYHDLITFVRDRPGHDTRYAIDASKIKRDLEWVPSETFETGLKKTVLWYLENQSWWKRVLSGEYRLERLGDNI